MAKKWSEVTSSPEYQNLSDSDKAAAQDQYFNDVVKPQLSPDDVQVARDQFYQQYPSAVNQPQQQEQPAVTNTPQAAAQEPEDKESMSYALQHPGEAFGALKDALLTGGAKFLLTDHSTGETATPTGAGANWYAQQMANPETAHNAGVVAKELPKQALYAGAAMATEGLSIPALEAMGVSAPIVANTVGRVGGNVAGSVASQEYDKGSVDLDQVANDVITGEIFHYGGQAVKAGYKAARNMLPEWLGGVSMVERAANSVSPEYRERVYQGGNEQAQNIYQKATSYPNGESALNPAQVFDANTKQGRRFIAEEQRDRARGSNSQYAQNEAYQQSGRGIERGLNVAENGGNLQQASKDVIENMKTRANELYQTSKTNAQQILDQSNVKQIKFPETKKVIQQHLDDYEKTGLGLTPEARKTFKDFQNAKIDSIDTLDKWKQELSEKAAKAYSNNDYTSSQALRNALNSLKSEADFTINSINPNAGSIYRDADKYYSMYKGDFGNKSLLTKAANMNNETSANQIYLGGAGYNTQAKAAAGTLDAIRALDDAVAGGRLDPELAEQFKQGLANATREESFGMANRNGFNPDTFERRLSQYEPQAAAAGESAQNQALRDVVASMNTQANVGPGLVGEVSRMAGRTAGAVAGTKLGGGYLGARAGEEVGARVSDMLGRLMDRFAGTAKTSKAIRNFINIPENEQLLREYAARRGANLETMPIKEIEGIIRHLTTAHASSLLNAQPDITQPLPVTLPKLNNQPAPQPEPEQQQEVAPMPDKYENSKRFYKSIASAETGGLPDPFIRTKAPEGGKPSTAYGKAQITKKLVDDFRSRNSKIFTKSELDYLDRLSEQGSQMLAASPDDPVYGYGAPGVLNTPEDRKLYDQVAVKMLDFMLKKNGGSYDKTLAEWRGTNKDVVYNAKVREAMKKSRRRGWGVDKGE
ncbi:hypothetical protein K4M64_004537 [Salmonella enterica]|nr:hypothetical protein [Salmonella enterica]